MGWYTDFVLTCSVVDDGDDGTTPWVAFEHAVHEIVGRDYFRLTWVHAARPKDVTCAMQLAVAVGVVKWPFSDDEFEQLREAIRGGGWEYPEDVLVLAQGEDDEGAWVLFGNHERRLVK